MYKFITSFVSLSATSFLLILFIFLISTIFVENQIKLMKVMSHNIEEFFGE